MNDLSAIGEFGLIAKIANLKSDQGDHVVLGIGDDAALLKPSKHLTALTMDMAVEGVHFRRDWSSAIEIGRKIAAANLADVAAMGGRAQSLVVGLAAPKTLEIEWALDLARGIVMECEREHCALVGGDTVQSEAIVISIAAMGEVEHPVRRSGAQVGDRIYLIGLTGLSAAGLYALSHNVAGFDLLKEAHRVPRPLYEQARQVAKNSEVHAMCDVSDGLLADLMHIAEASKVECEIDGDKLDVVRLTELAEVAGMDPKTWALTGGEDHAFLVVASSLADLLNQENLVCREIGIVTASHSTGTVHLVNGPQSGLAISGFDHFRISP